MVGVPAAKEANFHMVLCSEHERISQQLPESSVSGLD